MQLKRLIIEKFRKFSQQQVEFAPGINVVIGNNEAGKSTLSRALLEVLFENPATSKKERKLNTSWMHDGDMKLALAYEHDGSNYQLKKNFSTGIAALAELNTKAKYEDYQDVESKLLEQLGLPSRAVYESTAFIHQSDITAIHSSKKTDKNEFVAAVQRMAVAGGSDVNVKQIIADLEKTLTKMQVGLKGVAKNPGPIKATQDKIAELEQKLADIKQRYSQIVEAENTYQDSGSEITELKQQLKQQKQLLETNKQYQQAKKAHDELTKQLEQLSKQIEDVESLQSTSEQLKQTISKKFSIFNDENAEELHEYAISLRSELAKTEKLQAKLDQLAEKETKPPTKGINPVFFLSAAGLFIVIGILAWFVLNQALIAAGAGVAAAVFAAIFFTKQKQYSQVDEVRQSQLSEAQQLDDQLKEINASEESFLNELGLETLTDFFTKYKDYQATKTDLRDTQVKLKTTLQDKQFEELKSERRKLLLDQDKLEATKLTQEVVNSKLDGEAFHKLQSEYEQGSQRLQKLERQYTSAELRLEQSEVSQDQISNAENELEQLKQQLKRYEHRAQVIELTIELMKKATADIAATAGEMIAEKISQNLPQITNGRYHEARVTKALEIEVYSEEKQDWLAPDDNLSRGTVDQIYLLARLAFVDVLVGDQQIPIILDDPFVTFDAQRLTSTKQILQELAKHKQLILLTYDVKYKDWGNVIALEDL